MGLNTGNYLQNCLMVWRSRSQKGHQCTTESKSMLSLIWIRGQDATPAIAIFITTCPIPLLKLGSNYWNPNPMTKLFLTNHTSPYCLVTEMAAGRKSISSSNSRQRSLGHVVFSLFFFFLLFCPETSVLMTSTVTCGQLTTQTLLTALTSLL